MFWVGVRMSWLYIWTKASRLLLTLWLSSLSTHPCVGVRLPAVWGGKMRPALTRPCWLRRRRRREEETIGEMGFGAPIIRHCKMKHDAMIWKPPPPIPQSFESLSTLMADARGRNWYWLIYPLAECCKNLPKIGQSRATSGRKDRSNLKANLRVRSSLNNWAGSHATRDSSLSYHDTTLPTDLSFEGFAELLSAADKYQVPSLIDFCVMKLRENISTDNAVQGAILGSLYRNQDLKKDAIKAIVNAEINLSSMDGYEELRGYPDLLIEIVDYCQEDRQSGKFGKRKMDSHAGFEKRSRN